MRTRKARTAGTDAASTHAMTITSRLAERQRRPVVARPDQVIKVLRHDTYDFARHAVD